MSLRVNEMGVAEILEELEKIRKDPILQREAELQDKLRSISKSHFAQAKDARLYYLEGVDIDQLNPKELGYHQISQGRLAEDQKCKPQGHRGGGKQDAFGWLRRFQY